MDLFASPPSYRPPYRPARRVALVTRVAAAVGVLVVVAWLVAWLAATSAAPHERYRWSSTRSIYLASLAYEPVTCEVTPEHGASRTLRIRDARPRYWRMSALTVNGVRLDPWFTGDATVTCGRSVAVSSGPLLSLYPLAYTPVPPLLAIAAVVVWWRFGRARPERRRPSERSMRVARFLMRRP